MARTKNKRVLIADDNADAADTLGQYLKSLGYEVEIARDGEAAVGAAVRKLPSAAILDLGMPKLDGWTVCQHIRALPGGALVLMVALSGWGDPASRDRSARAGFDEHFTKPCDMAELLRRLEDF